MIEFIVQVGASLVLGAIGGAIGVYISIRREEAKRRKQKGRK